MSLSIPTALAALKGAQNVIAKVEEVLGERRDMTDEEYAEVMAGFRRDADAADDAWNRAGSGDGEPE